MTKISVITAIGKNNHVIGTSEGKIPWHISEDFKHFKETTMGKPMIMGRKTLESLPGILPGRPHIVVTRDQQYQAPDGVLVSHSFEGAIEIAKTMNSDEIFIVGGGQIYELGLPLADRLYITLIQRKDGKDIEGDVFFPEYEGRFTKEISRKESSDENYSYEFLVLEE